MSEMLEYALDYLADCWYAEDHDEPPPDATEIPGARGARGVLKQWTQDDGSILASASDAGRCIMPEYARTVARIGEPITCLYAIEGGSFGPLLYVRFADGAKEWAYACDCCFD